MPSRRGARPWAVSASTRSLCPVIAIRRTSSRRSVWWRAPSWCTANSMTTDDNLAMTARPEVCVGAIAVHNDRILLIERGRGSGIGLWSVPVGRVEAGETLAEAVLRELREETGLEGICGELLGIAERISAAYHYVILDYRVELLD